MKQSEDNRTLDLLEEQEKLAERRRKNAARQAAHRARLNDAGKVPVTLTLSRDVVDFLNSFVQFKDMSKDSAVETAIRRSLMRKR